MNVEITETANGTVARLAGPLDGIALASDRTAGEILANAATDALHLDLKNVPYLDTSGVGFLVQVLKRLGASGRSCTIRNASGQPADLLTALRLNTAFGVETADSVSDARDVIVAATTTENAAEPIATLAQAA